ncbi:LLM class flavin-dependent oxidoreductase [Nostoc sp. CHAB 5715]|uniref:LLM class flavin-dependent oxidoreductase n=1 Tax=Nostoc sp. CHAB 5715 TaxID=2780400 RepID=UPI001E2D88E5|nr:LLM class flavin-dependent oxidoreductase [Nostoc sp. CHAB 5715]MCC5621830.1 LLM class flavin-dependent oxidoreductase [Nostoc sp. CHAB 5715]
MTVNIFVHLLRQIRTLLNPLIVVRETEKEAEEYAQAIIDHADNQSIAGRSGVSSDAHAWRGHQKGNMRHGVGSAIGGNVQLIGSPEQITEQLLQLKRIQRKDRTSFLKIV